MIWAGHARQKFAAYQIKFDADTGEALLNRICELKRSDGEIPAKEDWNKAGLRADFPPPFTD